MRLLRYMALILLPAAALLSCSGRGAQTRNTDTQTQDNTSATAGVPQFDADSAYAYVAAQTAFGPRVPGSKASADCAAWLADKLRALGATDVAVQQAQVTAYDGTRLPIANISARFNPDAAKRVLLLSHWDSRPWADQSADASKRRTAIDGANDGASGVGVILETARQIAAQAPRIGVDVLLVDAEDYGVHADDDFDDPTEMSWCLGTRHWVQNPTIPLSQIGFAVLLDMVGGRNAVFPYEYYSRRSAAYLTDKVCSAAAAAGYSERFPRQPGNPIMDDHIPLLQAGVPAIDIIECANPETGCFNPTWHTPDDNIGNIDRNTLKAVGQTILQLIYTE